MPGPRRARAVDRTCRSARFLSLSPSASCLSVGRSVGLSLRPSVSVFLSLCTRAERAFVFRPAASMPCARSASIPAGPLRHAVIAPLCHGQDRYVPTPSPMPSSTLVPRPISAALHGRKAVSPEAACLRCAALARSPYACTLRLRWVLVRGRVRTALSREGMPVGSVAVLARLRCAVGPVRCG